MLNKPKGKCINSNQAHQVCYTENCQHLPFTCHIQDCSCQSQHEKCQHKQLSFQTFSSKLFEKDNSMFKCYKELLKFYDHNIKQLQVQRNQVLMIMDKGGIQMEKLESQLISYLRNQLTEKNQSIKVTGDLIFNVVKCLNVDHMEKVNHLEQKIKFEIEETNKSFKNSLGNLMKLIQMKQQFEGLIISSYLKSGGFDLFYPGILQLNTKKDDKIHFAMFQPSINSIPYNQITISFQVFKIYRIYFGIFQKNYLRNKKFKLQFSELSKGILGNFCGSLTMNDSPNQQIKQGERMQLIYNKKKQAIKIKNVDRYGDVEVKINPPMKSDKNYSFCVGMNLGSFSKKGLVPQIQYIGYQVKDE